MRYATLRKLIVAACVSVGLVGAPAQSQQVLDPVVITGSYVCEERFVDWMGAGGGYFMYECFEWASGTWGSPDAAQWDAIGASGIAGSGGTTLAGYSGPESIGRFARKSPTYCRASTERCDTWANRVTTSPLNICAQLANPGSIANSSCNIQMDIVTVSYSHPVCDQSTCQ
jgi:hypothetical protein